MPAFRITTKRGSVYRLLIYDTVKGNKSNAVILPVEKGRVKGEVAGIGDEIGDVIDFKTSKGYVIREKDIKQGRMIWTLNLGHTSPIASFRKE